MKRKKGREGKGWEGMGDKKERGKVKGKEKGRERGEGKEGGCSV